MQIGRTVSVTNFRVTDIEGTERGRMELIGGSDGINLDDDVLGRLSWGGENGQENHLYTRNGKIIE